MASWMRIHAELAANITSIARLVELPLVAGGVIAVNPVFVLAVTAITATTTEVIPAGKGKQVIDLPYADVITALGGTV